MRRASHRSWTGGVAKRAVAECASPLAKDTFGPHRELFLVAKVLCHLDDKHCGCVRKLGYAKQQTPQRCVRETSEQCRIQGARFGGGKEEEFFVHVEEVGEQRDQVRGRIGADTSAQLRNIGPRDAVAPGNDGISS